MLDLKYLSASPQEALSRLQTRDPSICLDGILALATERRSVATTFDSLRHEQKTLSERFRTLPKEEIPALRSKLKELSNELKNLEVRKKEIEEELSSELLGLPNLPQAETPVGRSDSDNAVLRTWSTPPNLDFEPRTHDEIGTALGIFDFDMASRISGARFWLYRGLGARLERALASFMLDLHIEQHGYEELMTPILVSRHCMVGTGQLPKFEEDAFKTADDDLFLIPTAEVSVTNVHREQILSDDDLPRAYVCHSSCFRREAGSYGRDTRGITRVHQFQKVELVHFVRPEESEAKHEALVGHAEAVLQALGLPYRVVDCCTGDIGFSSARTYDLEVWLPGHGGWREISSCSNFLDFQARRADIRYRPAAGKKPRFVHTLNGSGLAVGRTMIAILEHYQREDGGVDLPEVLWPYMGVKSLEPKG